MNTDALPQTLLEAVNYFADEGRAHDFLVAMRWGEGVTCPHCESANVGNLSVSTRTNAKGKTLTRRVWNCKACKRQFTVKVRTIFEDSPLSLTKWLPAVWMICNAKNGVSSHEIARALGVTQKSAWFMLHRIREAMRNGGGMFGGTVEADETYIGGRGVNMHRSKKKGMIRGSSSQHLTPVAGLIERGEGEKPSQVKACKVRNVKRAELRPNILFNVKVGATVYTDAHRSYNGLAEDYVHGVVDHAVSYVNGQIHTNSLENFWSLLKRTLGGTYVSVTPEHLDRYLDEQVTRFNERKDNDAERFASTLGRAAGRRLTYRRLTERDDELPA
ncbi:MAG: IS1595 family transposase [Verrucomicrobia bacterium]|nr:IS1595 family transposase [Verrucomicrobiota bacterium]